MKYKRKIIILGIIVLVLLISFVGVMIKMIVENGECIDNPFRYSAQKLKEAGGDYLCYCSSLDPRLLDFSFNAEDGIKIINPEENYLGIGNINISNIEIKGGEE